MVKYRLLLYLSSLWTEIDVYSLLLKYKVPVWNATVRM
ncbi:hypothetical protein M146_0811 [Bacteroides fragilis str. 1007-1-F |nr:hypothetical protein M146_0811 [Bacteroides fragilis str. 1007-1-F \